jgi:transcriptional regulator with XRE-family HTH domain
MTFRRLHSLLIQHLNRCIQRGEYTERGIARRVGLSQPHIHNLLKGNRLLSWESADCLLRELDLSVLDLIHPHEKSKDGPEEGYP